MTGIFNAAIGIADLPPRITTVREKLYAPPPIAALTHRRISVWFTLWPGLCGTHAAGSEVSARFAEFGLVRYARVDRCANASVSTAD